MPLPLSPTPVDDVEGDSAGSGGVQHPGPGSSSTSTAAAAVAPAAGGAHESSLLAPRLPPTLAMDVAEAAQHADAAAAAAKRAEDEAAAVVQAAAAAAAVAAAGSRPPTRQGLTEAVAVVGAALASAASQLQSQGQTLNASLRPRMPLNSVPEVLVVDQQGPSSDTLLVADAAPQDSTSAAAGVPLPPLVLPGTNTCESSAARDDAAASPVPGAPQEPDAGMKVSPGHSVASSGSTGQALDVLLDELVDGLEERPGHSMWQVQYQDGDPAPAPAAGTSTAEVAAVPAADMQQVAAPAAEPGTVGTLSGTQAQAVTTEVDAGHMPHGVSTKSIGQSLTPLPGDLPPPKSSRCSHITLPPPLATADEGEGSEEYDETVEDELMQVAAGAATAAASMCHSAQSQHPLSAPVVLTHDHTAEQVYVSPGARNGKSNRMHTRPVGLDPAQLSGGCTAVKPCSESQENLDAAACCCTCSCSSRPTPPAWVRVRACNHMSVMCLSAWTACMLLAAWHARASPTNRPQCG